MTDTDALRAALAKATPGPWRTLDQYIDTVGGALPLATGWYDHMTMEGGQHHEAALANAALIVAAVNALPSLLDRIAELEAQLGAVNRYALRDLMSEISERHFCAGWLRDLEYTLWGMAFEGSPRGFGMYPVPDEEVARLRELAEQSGVWWFYGDDGEEPAALDDFRKRYAARAALNTRVG